MAEDPGDAAAEAEVRRSRLFKSPPRDAPPAPLPHPTAEARTTFSAVQATSTCTHWAETKGASYPKGHRPFCSSSLGNTSAWVSISHAPACDKRAGRERCLFVRPAGSVLQKGHPCLENTALSLNQQHAAAHQILIRTQLLLKSFSLKAVGLEHTWWEVVSCLAQGKTKRHACCVCKRASRENIQFLQPTSSSVWDAGWAFPTKASEGDARMKSLSISSGSGLVPSCRNTRSVLILIAHLKNENKSCNPRQACS